MDSRTGARRAVRPGLFLLATAFSVLGLISTYLYFVHTTTGQFIDESALVEAAVPRQKIGTQVSYFLDLLPIISLVTGVVVVLFVTIWRRRWLASAIAILAMGAANASTQLFKTMLPERPDQGIATLNFNSLPSGHSTLAASAAVGVFLVVSPRWRPFAAFIGASFAILSGTSTLINQWHRPADVLAAYLMVAAWACLAGWLIMRWGGSWNIWQGYSAHWASSRLWPLLSALFGVAAAVVSCVLLSRLNSPGAQSSTDYFFSGVALIVIAGYLLTVAGTLLFSFEARRRPLIVD
ncbi:phosphatase PAP2 family protein [Psychromicrobium sp. YIM B11713]|uniref:phosphatase PAP2 family protein n=1 Tax=Psychromicrobium sp. YIM B11713 TaxID=3145233 RepID=UPI00374E3184